MLRAVNSFQVLTQQCSENHPEREKYPVPNILAYLFQYTTHIKVKHLEIFYSVETH
jgi:hypothetical protein